MMPFVSPPATGSRERLLAVLFLLVLILSIDVLGLVEIGDPKASGMVVLPPSTTGAWKALDADARRVLDKEEEVISEEIRLRIEQEHQLFALKFALVGGILGVFLQTAFRSGSTRLERTPFVALIAWAAVVAAAIVDLRVMANQTFLVTLGGWTRQYEQLALGPGAAPLGWESFLADTLLGKSHYPALRVNGQILTTLLFSITAWLFLSGPSADNDVSTARVSGAGAVVAISLMTMSAISIRRDAMAVLLYVVTGVLAALVAVFLARTSRQSE
jgi:hypothetical protein